MVVTISANRKIILDICLIYIYIYSNYNERFHSFVTKFCDIIAYSISSYYYIIKIIWLLN